MTDYTALLEALNYQHVELHINKPGLPQAQVAGYLTKVQTDGEDFLDEQPRTRTVWHLLRVADSGEPTDLLAEFEDKDVTGIRVYPHQAVIVVKEAICLPPPRRRAGPARRTGTGLLPDRDLAFLKLSLRVKAKIEWMKVELDDGVHLLPWPENDDILEAQVKETLADMNALDDLDDGIHPPLPWDTCCTRDDCETDGDGQMDDWDDEDYEHRHYRRPASPAGTIGLSDLEGELVHLYLVGRLADAIAYGILIRGWVNNRWNLWLRDLPSLGARDWRIYATFEIGDVSAVVGPNAGYNPARIYVKSATIHGEGQAQTEGTYRHAQRHGLRSQG